MKHRHKSIAAAPHLLPGLDLSEGEKTYPVQTLVHPLPRVSRRTGSLATGGLSAPPPGTKPRDTKAARASDGTSPWHVHRLLDRVQDFTQHNRISRRPDQVGELNGHIVHEQAEHMQAVVKGSRVVAHLEGRGDNRRSPARLA